MGQWSAKQPSSMLLSVPLVIISTLGVISFLGTRFIFSSIASSLSASLSGSVPERISPYSCHQDQPPPPRHPRYPPPYQGQPGGILRTKRSNTNKFLSSIVNNLELLNQLFCQVVKLSQSQDFPTIANIIRPLLEQKHVDIYDNVNCSIL